MPTKAQLTFPPSEEPPPTDDEDALAERAAAELGLAREEISAVRPSRVSFDARRRHRVWRVSLDVWTRGEELPAPVRTTPPVFEPPRADAPRVVVVGSGPAGLFCALDLVASGLRVTVVERGRDVQTRRRAIAKLHRGEPVDPESNYCFGEGGAGTYSDGKLYTRSGKKAEIRGVLETLVAHGAKPEILTSWRPHVGSNRLPDVVASIRESLLAAGAEVRFGLRAEELELAASEPRVEALVATDLDSGERVRLEADAVVLATGHSARDAVAMAARAGAVLEPKGFAMGVRIEHPQPWLDDRQYGGLRGECELPASFYELATEVEGRGVYSFCMCPGGFIVPTMTEGGQVVVNGMSLSRRDSPFANSGLVVAIEPEDWCGEHGRAWGWDALLATVGDAAELPPTPEADPTFGLRIQGALERRAADLGGGGHRAPSQRADLVAQGSREGGPELPTSYRPGVRPIDLRELFPLGLSTRLRDALPEFDRRIPGFFSELGQLLGVETRTSSPVRIARDRDGYEARGVFGLFPCGEGAGYAGGIVSAALDGRRVARAIARVHA